MPIISLPKPASCGKLNKGFSQRLSAISALADNNRMTAKSLASQIKTLAELKGEFRLRSGVVANRYFDKYRFESQPAILSEIAAQLEERIPAGVEKVAGLELGGIPLKTAVSLRSGIPCLYVRKSAKEYGTCHAVEGGFTAGQMVVVIEDVITSGGAVVTAVRMLRDVGLVVNDVLCVLDREAGGQQAIEELNCRVRSLFTLSDLC